MAYINDEAFDKGLDWITGNANTISICNSEPATYGAIAAAELGIKTGLVVGAAGDGTPDGRSVTVPAITDGAITSDGTASHWALHDNISNLIATGDLAATQGVTNGNPFTLDAIDITHRDATNAA